VDGDGRALPPGLWHGVTWSLVITDGNGRTMTERIKPPGTLKVGWLTEPVTLDLVDFGDAGVRRDVPADGSFDLVLDPDLVRATTGGLDLDVSALPSPPRLDKAEFSAVRTTENFSRIQDHTVSVRGLPAGSYGVRIDARGVDDGKQVVEVVAGRVTIVEARPRATQETTRIRGRLQVLGGDGWERLLRVELMDAATGETVDAWARTSDESFVSEVDPGSYRGRATVGRPAVPEAVEARLLDPDLSGRHRFEELPVASTFTCEARAGETTDVDFVLDLSDLAVVHLIAPSLGAAESASDEPPAEWALQVFRDGSTEELQSGFVGRWPGDPLSLRLAAGDYRIVASRWRSYDQLEACFTLAADERDRLVVLEPIPRPSHAPAPAAPR
jgi:hypothetical protein